VLAAWLLARCGEGAAQEAGNAADGTLRGELKRFLYDETLATVHSRSYLFDRQNQTPPNNVALVTGGWIGLQTGWFYDALQLGAVGYTSQPVWAPNDRWNTSDGTRLLKPDGYGFFTLGQAYASARWKGQTFTAYRQWIEELEVNPRDNREVPQTFEAYALRGVLGKVNYFAGYIAAIKLRDESAFINMAEAAGQPNFNAGMGLVSARYQSPDGLLLRAATYYVPNILWSSYGDAGGTIEISEAFRLRLAGQFAVQGSNGLNLLTGTAERSPTGAVTLTPGTPYGTFWGGARVDALWGPFIVTGAYTQVGSAAAWRSPYGVYIGFNKMQVRDFDRAGERAWRIGAGYDFGFVGLPGLNFIASATYGANAVDATTGSVLPEIWEYDLELRFSGERLVQPDWLKPLGIRLRLGFVDSYLNNTLSSITEYRAILNYEVSWKGPRR
jgi:hypothetical protein